jgi:uncharacterized protein (TIGR00369 family)
MPDASENLHEKFLRAGRFVSALPHCRVLQLCVDGVDETALHLRMPWQAAIVGNPVSGAIHGGSLTTLMDTACGTAVVIALPGFELCPTLDLRVDYMKSATARRDLVAHARVVRIASQVVFAEATVTGADDDELIARCSAAFMRIGAFMDGHPATAKGGNAG